MWFPVLFRFLAHSLTTFGRWGCGERDPLSHADGDPRGVFFGVGRPIVPQTSSKAFRRTERVFDGRPGQGGAENAYRGFQEGK
ncbi:rep protein, partial [Escherichia coli]